MNSVEIHSVCEEELEACLKTIHKAFRKNCDIFGFTKENYPSSGAYLTLEELIKAKEQGVHMYAAWIDGTVAGYVQLAKKETGVYSFQKFAVHPKYQNLGLGKTIVNFCKNRAKLYGGNKLVLIMVNENTPLKEFYIKMGFDFIKTVTDTDHPFEQAVMEMDLTKN